MKTVIYYGVTLTANLVAAVVFRGYLNITALSIIPVALIGLMIFQAVYFKNSFSGERTDATAYGSNYTRKEEKQLIGYMSRALILTIPLMIPFILFFPSAVKLLSVLVYLVGLMAGGHVYRIKNRRALKKRVDKEKDE